MKKAGKMIEKRFKQIIQDWFAEKTLNGIIFFFSIMMSIGLALFTVWHFYTFSVDKEPYTNEDIQPLYNMQKYIVEGGTLESIAKEIDYTISYTNGQYTINTKNKQVELTRQYDAQYQQIGNDDITDSYNKWTVIIAPAVIGAFVCAIVTITLYMIFYILVFFIKVIVVLVRSIKDAYSKKKTIKSEKS